MDKQWMRAPRSTTEYAAGVTKFLEFAAENAGMVHIVLCPCKTCANRFWNNRTLVSEHMYKCHLTISKFVHIPCLNISMVTRPIVSPIMIKLLRKSELLIIILLQFIHVNC
jgi:hypothetical protein